MKNIYIFLIASTLFVQGCGENKGNKNKELEKKQQELAQAKKQYGTLKEKIAALEKEIAKLDGSDTIPKGKLVVTETLKAVPFNHYIEVQGRVESDQNVDVTAQFAGTIERVLVKEGQQVNKGQLLAEIDASSLAAQIQSLKSQLDFSKSMYEKQKRLRAQNVGTEAQLLQAQSQYEALNNQLTSMQRQYNNSRVTAPISGVVDAKFVKQGSVAAPGAPMFRIVGGSDNKVVANVAESYIMQVRTGMDVKVYFPDLKKEIDGKVTNVSQAIERASRTFLVDVKIHSKDVRPNMLSTVKIQDYHSNSTITVPVNSVQHSEEGDFVMIARPQGKGYVSERRMVTKGITYNGRTQIISGLKAGDQVITTGYQDLVDDQAVRIKD